MMITVVSEHEIICRTCGQTVTPAEKDIDDDDGESPIGRCPTCKTILTTANSVPTTSYLRPGEYQLLIRKVQR